MLPISDLRNHPGIYAVEVRHVCPCGEMELMPASFALRNWIKLDNFGSKWIKLYKGEACLPVQGN